MKWPLLKMGLITMAVLMIAPFFLQSKSLVVCHAQASFTRPMTNHLTETACVFPKVVIDFDF
jgi:hypothetical protein